MEQRLRPYSKAKSVPVHRFWENMPFKKGKSPERLGFLRGWNEGKMDFGPAGGAGIGCGVGIGMGITGGLGFGAGPWNALRLVFGVGAGCGIGVGYGFGQGIGILWDRPLPKNLNEKRIVIEI